LDKAKEQLRKQISRVRNCQAKLRAARVKQAEIAQDVRKI